MATKKTLAFRDALHELEEITAWFERGEIDLDEGLKKYERALVLAAQCRSRLEEVENVVVRLKESYESSAPSSEDQAETSTSL